MTAPITFRLMFWNALGSLANMAGLPGFVREADYASETTATIVTVRRRSFYTVVTVNGVAVYFNRLSGLIDGVARPPEYTGAERPQ